MTTIAEADCRAAFEGVPVGAWAWHVHHEVLAEPLTEPASNRIDYILSHKPEKEQATRLRLMRPVKGALPEEFVRAWDEYNRAQAEYDRAWAELVRAGAECDRAVAEYLRAWAEYLRAWAEYDRARDAYVRARAELVRARDAYVRARDASARAEAKYARAWDEYDRAWAEAKPAIETLHAIECPDCPWDGKTIFPVQP